MNRMAAVLAASVAALALVLAGLLTGLVVADRDGLGWPGRHGTMLAGAGSESEYLAEMVAHHREAIAAARELSRSDRPEMRRLGADVVRTQTAQVEQMTAWLAEWYPEQRLDVGYDPMMRELASLSGDTLDRTFLVDMVGHHMAAVMMSQHLLVGGTDHEEVADLAREIRDEQHAEILVMRGWLVDWFGVGSGGPPVRGWGSHPMWAGP